MRRNPIICILVASLLIISLTGQAAAAFRMACEGTAACCCQNMATMPATGSETAHGDEGCCTVPVTQPCDLAGPVPAQAVPFLPTASSFEPEIPGAFAPAFFTPAPAIDARGAVQRFMGPPNPTGPPIYLQTQTFLC